MAGKDTNESEFSFGSPPNTEVSHHLVIYLAFLKYVRVGFQLAFYTERLPI